MYDYGARFYDPQIGRWHVLDLLAEKTIIYSPNVYVKNNPLMLIDPNGLKDITYNARTDKPMNPQPGTATPICNYDKNGQVVRDENGNPVLDPNAINAYN